MKRYEIQDKMQGGVVIVDTQMDKHQDNEVLKIPRKSKNPLFFGKQLELLNKACDFLNQEK